jgi:hypothetical protein
MVSLGVDSRLRGNDNIVLKDFIYGIAQPFTEKGPRMNTNKKTKNFATESTEGHREKREKKKELKAKPLMHLGRSRKKNHE